MVMFMRNVVSNMKMEGRSLVRAGPPFVSTKTRSNIFSEVYPSRALALAVIGRRSGRTMCR